MRTDCNLSYRKSIPSLQNVVVDSLQKARNFTGSVEELIENLDEKFDEATSGEDENNSINSRSITTTQAVFHNAITNVKKILCIARWNYTNFTRIISHKFFIILLYTNHNYILY